MVRRKNKLFIVEKNTLYHQTNIEQVTNSLRLRGLSVYELHSIKFDCIQ